MLEKYLEDTKPVPVFILELCTKKGFIACFYKSLKEFRTNRDCYEYLEELREEQFKEPLFASYDSFRQFKNRKNDKK